MPDISVGWNKIKATERENALVKKPQVKNLGKLQLEENIRCMMSSDSVQILKPEWPSAIESNQSGAIKVSAETK